MTIKEAAPSGVCWDTRGAASNNNILKNKCSSQQSRKTESNFSPQRPVINL